MNTRPFSFNQTTFTQFPVLRGGHPDMALPPFRGMREPGTNYVTTITAGGPRTIQNTGNASIPTGARG